MPNEVLTPAQLQELQNIAKKIEVAADKLNDTFIRVTPISVTQIFLVAQCLSQLLDDSPLVKSTVHLLAFYFSASVCCYPGAFFLNYGQRSGHVANIISNPATSFAYKKNALENGLSVLQTHIDAHDETSDGHFTNTCLSWFSYGTAGISTYTVAALVHETTQLVLEGRKLFYR